LWFNISVKEALRMADFFWFSDAQWVRIEPLLPVNGNDARRACDRPVLSGIMHALQGGGRWSDCLTIYGAREDALQPVRALGQARHMAQNLRKLYKLIPITVAATA
jgi:transposase